MAKISLEQAIEHGVQFLANLQEKNGSYFCLVTGKQDDYTKRVTCPAIVPTNIVLSSLIHIQTKSSERIKRKAANFLLSERGEYWSFNYWFRKSPEYISLPYPDDLDDTFCALAALYEYKPDIFDGEVLARIATMLTSAEEKEGGPYDMWLVPPEGRTTWKDTDLVVNSNIAYFLSLQDISLPGLDEFIDQSIAKKKYSFPYCSDYPGIYFVSRFYKGARTEEIVQDILKGRKKDGSWGNALYTALAISSLLKLSSVAHLNEIEKGIRYLLKEQENGGWKAYSFFFQMKNEENTVYAGSETITTALCLEAINTYRMAREKPESKTEDVRENNIYDAVLARAAKRLAQAGPEIASTADQAIASIFAKDTSKQIVLLPYYFARFLKADTKVITEELLVSLGTANLLGWLAYTIYDDFLDGAGQPQLLPLANIALREVSRIFGAILPETNFAEYSRKVLDEIEAANHWEVTHYRIEKNSQSKHPPDFNDLSVLAKKSFGHALGPIAVMYALGRKKKEIEYLEDFFRHYLIARQLNDDTHDWEEDYNRGHVTMVTADLMKRSQNASTEKLQEVFWHDVIHTVCTRILEECNNARKAHAKIDLKNTEFTEALLGPIERSTHKALKEHQETIQFLALYQQKD